MWDWLDQVWDALSPSKGASPRPTLHRRFRLSGQVVAWLRDPERSELDHLGFAELLLRLDSDPTRDTFPVLRPGSPLGMRWTEFAGRRAIFVIDIAENRISMLSCT